MIIESERLRIRPRTMKEMDKLYKAEQDEEMKKAYLEMIKCMKNDLEHQEWGADWLIELKEGTSIGGICFKGGPDEKGIVEIGYGIDEEYRRKGYATEAVYDVTEWAMKQKGVLCVTAQTDIDNEISKKVLRKNNFVEDGMGEEGPLFKKYRYADNTGSLKEKVIIREERESDYYETELVAKRAFWNLHVPGCNEHYLVHLLRESKDYLPELSRVAEIDGKIVGEIFYAMSYVMDGDKKIDVLTFGPLCVDPMYQNLGIGSRLLEETMEIARQKGHKAIIIFGEPYYYPRHGFKTCDNFGITTCDGENFDPFMGIELVKDGLKDVKGKFYEAAVYEECNSYTAKADEYDKKFPYMMKLKMPWQWN